MMTKTSPHSQAATGRPTTHVRVNVTAADVAEMRRKLTAGHAITDRTNAVATAINRTLRDGYAATFDGLSVGILDLKRRISAFVADSMVFWDSDGSQVARLRASEDAGSESFLQPFFRGVPKRAQKHHQRLMARRKVQPMRVAISLPTECLKRTIALDVTNF